MVLQKTKQRVKDFIKHRNAQAQYEFYQRLFDGEKTTALRTLIIPKRAGETDLFADYKAKKTMNADEILSVLQQYDVISFGSLNREYKQSMLHAKRCSIFFQPLRCNYRGYIQN